jgi:Family of unknown function (DUF5906)
VRELPAALAALGAYKQFLVYKAVPSESRPGKTDKFPIDHATGRYADAHNQTIHLSFDRASQIALLWGDPFGVGFVFTERDPFWFLDIDNCLLAGGWAPHAIQACQLLSGCAVEVSRSGKGLHLFGSGKPPAHTCKNSLDMEFYHTGRFVALTGINAQGDVSRDFTPVLSSLVTTYFPPDKSQQSSVEWTSSPVPEWKGIEDDQELIRRAIASHTAASSFGSKASFADLWFADEKALGRAFPDPVRAYDASGADSSLAQHLAFWTGKDCERIRRLMLMSKLVRDKWEREDYLVRTILGVVARQIDVFQAREPVSASHSLPSAGEPSENLQDTQGSRILTANDQKSLFAGAIYITDSHRVLISGGHILKPDQFRVHFGGYNFIMDRNNDRMSRDPWEAFTQSQLIRPTMVNGTCFRPDLPAGEIISRNGQTFVNTYVPVAVARMEGDPTPFLMHLSKVLPDPRDQSILLGYMAACVQHKGVKFQWAPLLQGVEGNGKTLFSRCVAEAIGRRYTHWPRASQLSKNFNAWMKDKIFFAVEDIYVPDARREIIEELKPMITGDNLEIEAKGIDQTNADICGNFMFNSNHRDAIKKTGNDRRFCVLFSAQQESSHLQRDGMGGNYFPDLYKWIRADGYAIVSEFLYSYQIPQELNPAGDCQRAPVSSTTGEALQASQGSIEQEILESVAQGLPGFNGGWISSIYLERLLDRMGMRKISHVRRREILQSLGYHPHPALLDGRVSNAVLPDGGKPRLFVHDSSLAKQISSPSAAAKEYETSNKNQPHLSVPFEQKYSPR